MEWVIKALDWTEMALRQVTKETAKVMFITAPKVAGKGLWTGTKKFGNFMFRHGGPEEYFVRDGAGELIQDAAGNALKGTRDIPKGLFWNGKAWVVGGGITAVGAGGRYIYKEYEASKTAADDKAKKEAGAQGIVTKEEADRWYPIFKEQGGHPEDFRAMAREYKKTDEYNKTGGTDEGFKAWSSKWIAEKEKWIAEKERKAGQSTLESMSESFQGLMNDPKSFGIGSLIGAAVLGLGGGWLGGGGVAGIMLGGLAAIVGLIVPAWMNHESAAPNVPPVKDAAPKANEPAVTTPAAQVQPEVTIPKGIPPVAAAQSKPAPGQSPR